MKATALATFNALNIIKFVAISQCFDIYHMSVSRKVFRLYKILVQART